MEEAALEEEAPKSQSILEEEAACDTQQQTLELGMEEALFNHM